MSLLGACVGYDVTAGRLCSRDAVDEIAAGCVHEHVGPHPLCQYHLADLAQERAVCGNCQMGADPHQCVLVATPGPDRPMTGDRDPDLQRRPHGADDE